MNKVKYSLSINPSVMDMVDMYADLNDMSRSSAVNELLYAALEGRYDLAYILGCKRKKETEFKGE